MATSAQMVTYLKNVITTDAASRLPVIPFFLNGNMAGGWEGWLQVAFARFAIGNLPANSTIKREVSFVVPVGAPALRCDLQFTPSSDIPIWFELKTQRSAAYLNTVTDFIADCNKIKSQNDAWRVANVFVAAAVLKLVAGDPKALNTFRLTGRPSYGVVTYYQFTSPNTFKDVTEAILDQAVGTFILATYRAG